MRRLAFFAAALGLAGTLSFAAPGALAETWPTRPISLVVPFAAGGGHDSMARICAERRPRSGRR